MPTEDEERFTRLYEETKARIVAYVLRRTASHEDAADIVAETYAIAWRRLEVVPSGHDGLLWLYVTARHLLQNRGRRLRYQDDLVARLAEEIAQAGLAEEALDEEALVALSCLDALPADEREVLLLAAWEGLEAAAIGRVLGCSPTAARIRLHRARARLRTASLEPGPSAKRRAGPGHGPSRGTATRCVPEEA